MDVPMNLDNFYSAHEDPVIEGNTHMKTRVKNMEKIKNEVETIIKYGETHQENVNELILKIQLVSNMYFQHYDKTYNIFNYKIKNEDNNNLLMVCCSKKFNSIICNFIINKHRALFDLGHVNDNGDNALIICIKNKMDDVALNLINKHENLFDLGHVDANGDNALILCIKKKMDHVASNLIDDYGNLFNLGHVDVNGDNALILCIKKKWIMWHQIL
jgi:hypothetical protein